MTRTREQSLSALKAFRDAQNDWDLDAGSIDEESGLTVADLYAAIEALSDEPVFVPPMWRHGH